MTRSLPSRRETEVETAERLLNRGSLSQREEVIPCARIKPKCCSSTTTRT